MAFHLSYGPAMGSGAGVLPFGCGGETLLSAVAGDESAGFEVEEGFFSGEVVALEGPFSEALSLGESRAVVEGDVFRRIASSEVFMTSSSESIVMLSFFILRAGLGTLQTCPLSLILRETGEEVESGFRLMLGRFDDAEGFVVPLEGFFTEFFFTASEGGVAIGFCFVLGRAGGR